MDENNPGFEIRERAAVAEVVTSVLRHDLRNRFASIRNASAPPTPRSSSIGDRLLASWRCMMRTTMPAQQARAAALTSSRLTLPISSTKNFVSPAPSAPPRLAPPPMKPNTRLACRAS